MLIAIRTEKRKPYFALCGRVRRSDPPQAAGLTSAASHVPLLLLAALATTFLLGCGDPGYTVAPVSGKITFGDKPLSGIHVSFQPKGEGAQQSKPGPGSVGVTDAQGRFTLRTVDPQQDGAVLGRHVVRLSRNTIKEDIKNDLSTPRRFLLPEKCRDGSLVFMVPQGGTDAADFDLQSLAGKP